MTGEIDDRLREVWRAYIDMLTPLRPVLHTYCRRLTRSVWDAEDLVQDTLLRSFGQWAVTYPAIRDLKAYLLRTATNVWIDTLRKRETESRTLSELAAEPPSAGSVTPTDIRDAGFHLLQLLSPQERAAIVLKEVFDVKITEIAALLATTEAAVKAALHRGRGRLTDAPARHTQRPSPPPELLDRFVDCFQAKDTAGLLALMLDGAVAENVGNSYHQGHESPIGLPHFLDRLIHGHEDWPLETRYESSRLERVEWDGEPILLLHVMRRGRESLMTALRVEEADGRIARLRAYGFCPDTMRELGKALNLHVFTGLYRAPEPKGH